MKVQKHLILLSILLHYVITIFPQVPKKFLDPDFRFKYNLDYSDQIIINNGIYKYQIVKYEKQIMYLRNMVQQIEKTVKIKNIELQNLKAKFTRCQQLNYELRYKIEELSNKITKLYEENKKLLLKNSRLEHIVDSLKNEIIKANQIIASLKEIIIKQRDTITKLKKEIINTALIGSVQLYLVKPRGRYKYIPLLRINGNSHRVGRKDHFVIEYFYPKLISKSITIRFEIFYITEDYKYKSVASGNLEPNKAEKIDDHYFQHITTKNNERLYPGKYILILKYESDEENITVLSSTFELTGLLQR